MIKWRVETLFHFISGWLKAEREEENDNTAITNNANLVKVLFGIIKLSVSFTLDFSKVIIKYINRIGIDLYMINISMQRVY